MQRRVLPNSPVLPMADGAEAAVLGLAWIGWLSPQPPVLSFLLKLTFFGSISVADK